MSMLAEVLYQEHDENLQLDRNDPTHKLKFVALKWVVLNMLKDYLYGADFVVQTNGNPLT